MKRQAQPIVSEAQIQEACADLLALDDWRRIRTDLKRLRGMGVQEPGMADDLFIRYWTGCLNQIAMKPPFDSWTQVLWIEFKKLDKRGKPTKASPKQIEWQALERKRGALVWQAGVDFPATIEGFRDHYKVSGLMRRKIIS
jgi:hypothetical protein